MEAAVLGGMDVYVKSGHGVDPYFRLAMFNSMDRWQKVSFFLKNDVATLLPAFTGNRLIPQPNWGMEWTRGTSVSFNHCLRSFKSYNKRG
jgi:hypothetical protein